jgi:hypothetical protein
VSSNAPQVTVISPNGGESYDSTDDIEIARGAMTSGPVWSSITVEPYDNMVLVPASEFTMGSNNGRDNEQPATRSSYHDNPTVMAPRGRSCRPSPLPKPSALPCLAAKSRQAAGKRTRTPVQKPAARQGFDNNSTPVPGQMTGTGTETSYSELLEPGHAGLHPGPE